MVPSNPTMDPNIASDEAAQQKTTLPPGGGEGMSAIQRRYQEAMRLRQMQAGATADVQGVNGAAGQQTQQQQTGLNALFPNQAANSSTGLSMFGTQPGTDTSISQSAMNRYKARNQSTFQDRLKRAEDLIKRINTLRKPIYFEKLGSMIDSKRVL